uniref:Cilia- and flagella-associated protein 299 n=1 Tax=Ornithorhynchus anatinus TaxID=9258 RepID=A0A6I8NUQ1_ORNAN
MEGDELVSAVDNIVTQFSSYEDFLDSQITTLDLYYLEDEELARQLVELGYRGSGEVLKREEFVARKAAIEAARLAERTQKKTLSSAGKELKDPFLQALAQREEANRSGKMTMRLLGNAFRPASLCQNGKRKAKKLGQRIKTKRKSQRDGSHRKPGIVTNSTRKKTALKISISSQKVKASRKHQSRSTCY